MTTDSTTGPTVDNLNQWASNAAQSATEAFDGLDEQVRNLMRSHPVAALAGAVAAGFFIGRLIARPQQS